MVPARRDSGFTLIEILIVISIIAILMSMILGGIIHVRKMAAESVTVTMVDRLSTALDQFYSDEGYYPGAKVDHEENAFPVLFEALLGDPDIQGSKAGRNAPYVEGVKERDIAVFDPDTGVYRAADPEELMEPDIEKFLIDNWGEPLWYRVNKGRPREVYMHNHRKADVWSTGPNRRNQSTPFVEEGEEEDGQDKNDDIGNW